MISGSHLPKPEGEQNTSDLVDPYVKVDVFGVKDDGYEFKTAPVTDNGERDFSAQFGDSGYTFWERGRWQGRFW